MLPSSVSGPNRPLPGSVNVAPTVQFEGPDSWTQRTCAFTTASPTKSPLRLIKKRWMLFSASGSLTRQHKPPKDTLRGRQGWSVKSGPGSSTRDKLEPDPFKSKRACARRSLGIVIKGNLRLPVRLLMVKVQFSRSTAGSQYKQSRGSRSPESEFDEPVLWRKIKQRQPAWRPLRPTRYWNPAVKSCFCL
jgi:hypothetical protein